MRYLEQISKNLLLIAFVFLINNIYLIKSFGAAQATDSCSSATVVDGFMREAQEQYTADKNCGKSPTAILDRARLGTVRPKEACREAYDDLTQYAKNYLDEKQKQCAIIKQATAGQSCDGKKGADGKACMDEAAAKLEAAAEAEKKLKSLLTEGEKKMADHAMVMEGVQKIYELHRQEMHQAWDETVRKIQWYEEQAKQNWQQDTFGDTAAADAQLKKLREERDRLAAGLEAGSVIENNMIKVAPEGGAVVLAATSASESTISGYLSNLNGKKDEAAQTVRYANQFKKIADQGIKDHTTRQTTFTEQAKALRARAKNLNSNYDRSDKDSDIALPDKVPVPERRPENKPAETRTAAETKVAGTELSAASTSGQSQKGNETNNSKSSSANNGLANLAPLASAGAASMNRGASSGSNMGSFNTQITDGQNAGVEVEGNPNFSDPKNNVGEALNNTKIVSNNKSEEAVDPTSEYAAQYDQMDNKNNEAEVSSASRIDGGSTVEDLANGRGAVATTSASLGQNHSLSPAETGINSGDLGAPKLSISGIETKSTMRELASDFGLGDLFGSMDGSTAEKEEVSESGLFGSLTGKMGATSVNNPIKSEEAIVQADTGQRESESLDSISLFERVHDRLQINLKKGNLLLVRPERNKS
ncbi:MAG: hypothetical protein M9962_00795 [Oligoflexia bacterium]|nr:hypothetical protein [Oligoflexia bacterium]